MIFSECFLSFLQKPVAKESPSACAPSEMPTTLHSPADIYKQFLTATGQHPGGGTQLKEAAHCDETHGQSQPLKSILKSGPRSHLVRAPGELEGMQRKETKSHVILPAPPTVSLKRLHKIAVFEWWPRSWRLSLQPIPTPPRPRPRPRSPRPKPGTTFFLLDFQFFGLRKNESVKLFINWHETKPIPYVGWSLYSIKFISCFPQGTNIMPWSSETSPLKSRPSLTSQTNLENNNNIFKANFLYFQWNFYCWTAAFFPVW